MGHMGVIQVFFKILLWEVPISLSETAYLKMNREEQREIRDDLKRPSFLIGIGFTLLGLLLLLSSTISGMKLLNHIGAIMLIISCFSESNIFRLC